jgi:ABC-2 type transport system permease protein
MSTPEVDSGSTDGASPGGPPTGNSLLGDVWVNFTRWNRKAIRNPTAFVLEIVIGLFSLVLFAAVFGDVGEFALAEAGYGDVGYVTYLVPAVLNAATMLFMFPLLFLSPAFIPMSGDIEALATVNPVTYGVDAVRALVLGEDVMTALDVAAFGGVWNTLVPALAVLVALDLVVGALAVWLLGRASSADAE